MPRTPDQMDEEINEGEGNKTADRAYREHLGEFMDQNDVERLAREAAQDVERDPGLAEAEAEGKRHIAEEDPTLRQ